MAEENKKRSLWDRIQFCDPRILYALFAVVVIGFEMIQIKMPVPNPVWVGKLYDRIESLPPDKAVLIDCDYGAGNRGECEGQFKAVIQHLFARNIKFMVVTWTTNVEGQKLGRQVLDEVAKKMNKVDGEDYVMFQAIVNAGGVTLQSLAKDIHGFVVKDINGRDLNEIPMMKNFRSIADVSLIYRVAYSWGGIPWIGFVQSVYGTPLAAGSAGIESSTAYPYLDSGQLCGLLAGAAGAAAYEKRVMEAGIVGETGIGTKTVSVQSFATLFVVVSILISNFAMFMSKLQSRKGKA